jgi:hypothetical protein
MGNNYNLSLIWVYGLIFFSCSGCSTYQYITLGSYLKSNQAQQFTYETDSIRVQYSFNGQNGPVQIDIYNKREQPIYVDWRKSALIVNENTIPYWIEESVFNATSQVDPVLPLTNTTGLLVKPEPIGFIPPKASIKKNSLFVRRDFFALPQTSFNNVSKVTLNGERVTKYYFQQNDSPLKFRSYVTLSTREDFSNSTVLDNQFWVSEIWESPLAPYSFPENANQFYVRRTRVTGLAVAGGVTIVVGICFLPVMAFDGLPDSQF